MKNLKIEKKPFSETKHYSGTYTYDSSLSKDEYQEEICEFTVVVIYDNDNQSYNLEEIIWIDELPRDVDEVDDYINEHFFEIIN
jgi:hypothetical protein